MNTQATQSVVILAGAIIGIVLLQRTARAQARNLGLSPHMISDVTAGIGFAIPR
jgi:preprotein translocase subunit SecG